MPTIDASIYNALFQPQKSAMDYADQYAAADDRQMARQFNALKMQEAQQVLQDQAGYRNALSAATGDEQTRAQSLIRSGNPIAVKHGQEMLKALLDAQKTKADIGKTKADTSKTQGEAVDAALKRYRGALDFIDTPQGAQRWLQAQYSDPSTAAYMQQLGPYEQAVTSIPTDPQAFQNWRGQAAMGMEKHMQQIRAQKEYELKAKNELIGPDGQVNQTLVGLKQGIAKAGAANVSVNTGQKGLDNEFKLRGEFKSEPVYKAHQEMQAAYGQIKQSIAQASPAGDLAAATKIMKLLDPGSVVRESELGMAMQASGLMDRVQNFVPNILSGQKLTPQQRKDFQALADALYGESVKAYNGKRGEYEKLGGEYGLNAGRAIGPSASGPATTADVDSLVEKYRTPKNGNNR